MVKHENFVARQLGNMEAKKPAFTGNEACNLSESLYEQYEGRLIVEMSSGGSWKFSQEGQIIQ